MVRTGECVVLGLIMMYGMSYSQGMDEHQHHQVTNSTDTTESPEDVNNNMMGNHSNGMGNHGNGMGNHSNPMPEDHGNGMGNHSNPMEDHGNMMHNNSNHDMSHNQGSNTTHDGMAHGDHGTKDAGDHGTGMDDHGTGNTGMGDHGMGNHGAGTAGDHSTAGGHGGGHVTYFTSGVDSILLLEEWITDSWQTMLAACFGVGIAGALYEGFKVMREKLLIYANNRKYKSASSCLLFDCIHMFQSVLHILQVFISYTLMLVFMTFNIWLCLSLCVGAGLGYWIFHSKRKVTGMMDINEHCN